VTHGLVAAAAVVGLLLAALGFNPTTAGAKVPKEFYGIAEGGGMNPDDLKQMRKIKVRTLRLNVAWSAVERQPGKFTWPDRQILSLADHGIRPVITVGWTPGWATRSGSSATPPIRGDAKKAWRKFLKKLVRRYKRNGVLWREHPDVSPKPVKAWQIWNEPNLPKYLDSKKAPKDYAKLIKISDKAISKADRRAKTVLAGLTGNPKKKKLRPEKFIKKFLKARKVKRRFDAAAIHPYGKNYKQFKSRVKKFRKAMKKRGAKKKGIWLTETGWGSEKDSRFDSNKGTKGQARLLKKSFKLAMEKRKKWNIDRVYWFHWRDPPPNAPRACGFCRTAGLLKFNRTPKLSYKKFRHFTKLQGKRRR
jgi:hypothetical protein